MKKLLYILCFILFFAACKYEKTELSFNRHYNIYTFLTQRGAAKYFCAKPDTTLAARDEYAIVKGEVTYLSLAKDSILVYGHCWSKSRDFKYDKRYSTFNMIDEDVDTVPDEPIFEGSILALGKTFESVMPYLTPETDYYVKS